VPGGVDVEGDGDAGCDGDDDGEPDCDGLGDFEGPADDVEREGADELDAVRGGTAWTRVGTEAGG
jgi:hypothetical protein